MDTAAVVLLALVGLLLVAALIYAIVRQRQRAPAPETPATGPMYKRDEKPVQYYRPAPAPLTPGEPRIVKPDSSDPRDAPLPRCPNCDTAIAYTETRCPKCGFELRPL